MKQLGNLAIICAQRDDLCLTIYKGQATIHIGCGPDKKSLSVNWSDDDAISKLTYELNHSKYRDEGESADAEVMQSVYICYEENCPNLTQEAGTINELSLFCTKESRNIWIKACLDRAEENSFIIDEEIGGPEKLDALIGKEESINITLFRSNQENWNEHYNIIAQKINIEI